MANPTRFGENYLQTIYSSNLFVCVLVLATFI